MIEIREIESADVKIVVDFQVKMAKETENTSLDPFVVQAGMEALLKDSSKGLSFVAVVENQIIGCLMLTNEWSEWRNGNIYWIQSVYVIPAFRGQGVFKKLYLHVKELVEADPINCGIRLYVHESNSKAKDVYSQLGMTGGHYSIFEWIKEN